MQQAQVEALLGEAAARLQAEHDADVRSEAGDILQAEYVRASLADRLRGSASITVLLSCGDAVTGLVGEADESYALIHAETGSHLIRMAAVRGVCGLGMALADEAPPAAGRRSTWGRQVRDLADEPVRVQFLDGTWLAGRVLAGYADHVDIRPGEGAVLSCPFGAITRLVRPRTDG